MGHLGADPAADVPEADLAAADAREAAEALPAAAVPLAEMAAARRAETADREAADFREEECPAAADVGLEREDRRWAADIRPDLEDLREAADQDVWEQDRMDLPGLREGRVRQEGPGRRYTRDAAVFLGLVQGRMPALFRLG